MSGFHAGETAWVVFKERPGTPYIAKLLEIESAMLIDGNKVRYRFKDIEKPVPASRVCATISESQRVLKRLNKDT